MSKSSIDDEIMYHLIQKSEDSDLKFNMIQLNMQSCKQRRYRNIVTGQYSEVYCSTEADGKTIPRKGIILTVLITFMFLICGIFCMYRIYRRKKDQTQEVDVELKETKSGSKLISDPLQL